jgi:hypothetical protein
VIVGDGRSGWSQNAPYDRIIVTASSLDVPRMWRNQLKDGGLVVLPLRLTDSLPFRQIVVAFRREEDRLVSQSVLRGGFMRLRANPADRSLPWPALTAVASDDGPERHVATISGESLRMMSKDVNRRLLSLLLTEPRSRSLPLRAKGWHQYELESFIALSAPEERLVGYVTEKVEGLILMSTALPALVDGGGDGLAGLAGGRSISRIDAYGRRSPDIALARMTDAWIRAGRPTVDRLCVTVAYDGRRPHVWKAVKRGESTIGFDWR